MAFTYITVTGTYVQEDGSVAIGTVSFQASAFMQNGNITVNDSHTVTLDANGHFSTTLAATDDPGTVPVGVVYQVAESMKGAPVRQYYIVLSHLTTPVDLSTIFPAQQVNPSFGGVVTTTGNQTINGVKTFISSPIVPDPTAPTQAANKEYVDSHGSTSTSTFVVSDKWSVD